MKRVDEVRHRLLRVLVEPEIRQDEQGLVLMSGHDVSRSHGISSSEHYRLNASALAGVVVAGSTYRWTREPDGDVLPMARELTPELFEWHYDAAGDAALGPALDWADGFRGRRRA